MGMGVDAVACMACRMAESTIAVKVAGLNKSGSALVETAAATVRAN
jgi:hypothetical protein